MGSGIMASKNGCQYMRGSGEIHRSSKVSGCARVRAASRPPPGGLCSRFFDPSSENHVQAVATQAVATQAVATVAARRG